MWIIHVLIAIVKGLSKGLDKNEVHPEISLSVQRATAHKDIPDIDVVKRQFGIKFNMLQKILDNHDIVAGPTAKTDPDKYAEATRTILYRLPHKKTSGEVSQLLSKEFMLWFGSNYWDKNKKLALDHEVYSFKSVNLFTHSMKHS